MAFFDKVVKKTQDLTDISRLNSQTSAAEKRIAELYSVIGLAYYENHKDDSEAESIQVISEINQLYAQIEAVQSEIKKIKGFGKCPQCGADVPQGALFCSSCGYKMEVAVVEKRFCTSCGAQLAADSLFCTNCGTPVAGTVNAAPPVESAAEPVEEIAEPVQEAAEPVEEPPAPAEQTEETGAAV